MLGSTVAWIEKRRRSGEADDVDLLVAGGGEPNLAACDFEGARAELDVGRAAKPRPRLNARSENEAEQHTSSEEAVALTLDTGSDGAMNGYRRWVVDGAGDQ